MPSMNGDIQNSSLFTGPGSYEMPLSTKSSSLPGPCNAACGLQTQPPENERHAPASVSGAEIFSIPDTSASKLR